MDSLTGTLVEDCHGDIHSLRLAPGRYMTGKEYPADHFLSLKDGSVSKELSIRLSNETIIELSPKDFLLVRNAPDGWVGIYEVKNR